eukprot:364342-Chlamydomonas_euryale.AAC.3
MHTCMCACTPLTCPPQQSCSRGRSTGRTKQLPFMNLAPIEASRRCLSLGAKVSSGAARRPNCIGCHRAQIFQQRLIQRINFTVTVNGSGPTMGMPIWNEATTRNKLVKSALVKQRKTGQAGSMHAATTSQTPPG